MSQGFPYGPPPSNPYGDPNPYQPPQGPWTQPQSPWGTPPGYTPGVPVFCTIMFIASLVFCFIRAAIVAISFLTIQSLPAGHVALKVIILEIGTGIGMVLCGVAANALLLAKNQIGVFLGWGLVAFTAASMLTSIVSVIVIYNNPGMYGTRPTPGFEGAYIVGMIIGASIPLLIRLCLVTAYGAALVQFQKWYSRYGQGGEAAAGGWKT